MRTEAEWQERERQLLARNSELVERARAAESALREVEWSEVRKGYHFCPLCDRPRNFGHNPDCQISAVLRGACYTPVQT